MIHLRARIPAFKMLPQLLARLLESGWLPVLFLASPTLGFLCVIYFFSSVPPVHSPDGIVVTFPWLQPHHLYLESLYGCCVSSLSFRQQYVFTLPRKPISTCSSDPISSSFQACSGYLFHFSWLWVASFSPSALLIS